MSDDNPEEEIDGFSLRSGETVEHSISPSLVGFATDDSGHIALIFPTLFVLPYLWASKSQYVITDERVVKKTVEYGFGDEEVTEFEHDELATITTTETAYEGMVGTGNVQLSTETGEFLAMWGASDHEELADTIDSYADAKRN